MRLVPRTLAFVLASLVISMGCASAVTVTNDHAPTPGASAHVGHALMPVGVPLMSHLSSATIANADVAAVDADADAGAGSNDPDGKVLGVWVWILPISGILCIAAYAFVNTLVNRSIAESAARRGVKSKSVGFFV